MLFASNHGNRDLTAREPRFFLPPRVSPAKQPGDEEDDSSQQPSGRAPPRLRELRECLASPKSISPVLRWPCHWLTRGRPKLLRRQKDQLGQPAHRTFPIQPLDAQARNHNGFAKL